MPKGVEVQVLSRAQRVLCFQMSKHISYTERGIDDKAGDGVREQLSELAL